MRGAADEREGGPEVRGHLARVPLVHLAVDERDAVAGAPQLAAEPQHAERRHLLEITRVRVAGVYREYFYPHVTSVFRFTT